MARTILILSCIFCALLSVCRPALGANIWASPTSSETANCGSSAQQPCSLGGALNLAAASGDVIVLLSGEYQQSGIILSSKSVTIQPDLNAQVLFTQPPSPGPSVTSIFEFHDCQVIISDVTFSGLTFTAIQAMGDSRSSLELRGVTFQHFLATPQPIQKKLVAGGAVFAQTNFICRQCLFLNNTLVSHTSLNNVRAVLGGAVSIFPNCSNPNLVVELDQCLFKDNAARSTQDPQYEVVVKGGAVSVQYGVGCNFPAGSRGSVKITSSSFVHNHASLLHLQHAFLGGLVSGGAVDIAAAAPLDITVDQIRFSHNWLFSAVADQTGGINQGSHLHITSNDFTSTATIRQSTFVKGASRASEGTPVEGSVGGVCTGGAMAFHGSHVLEIHDSQFDTNQCVGGQGGVLGGSADGGALFYHSDYIGSIARRIGVIVQNTSFTNNEARSTRAPHDYRDRSSGSAMGGAAFIHLGLDASSYVFRFDGCRFDNNTARAAPGGWLLGGGISFFLTPTANRNNSFKGDVDFKISSSVFYRNTVQQAGTAYALASIAMGGAVSYSPRVNDFTKAMLKFENSIFVENAALGGPCQSDTCAPGSAIGGAIFVQEPYAADPSSAAGTESARFKEEEEETISFVATAAQSYVISIDNSTFQMNMAQCGGPDDGSIALSCRASGGAVYVPSTLKSYLNVTSSSFTLNQALAKADRSSAHGGAIAAPHLFVTSSKFHNNSAGDMFADISDTILALTANGGALWSAHVIIGSDLEFVGNNAVAEAAMGGAVAGKYVSIVNSNFSMDTATALGDAPCEGGAIYVYDPKDIPSKNEPHGELFISNVHFTNTRAIGTKSDDVLDKSAGGAVYTAGHLRSVSMHHVKFDSCYSSQHGGAIYFGHFSWLFMPVSLANLTFTNCSAGVAGAGAFFSSPTRWPGPQTIAQLCLNSSTFNFVGGSALYGDNCATPPVSLEVGVDPETEYRQVPTVVWPGQLFSVSLHFLDAIGNIVVTESISIQAEVNGDGDSPLFHTSLARNTATASATGMFEFPRISIMAPMRSNVTLAFIPSGWVPQDLIISQDIVIGGCPPHYFPYAVDETESLFGCNPCPTFRYNLGDSEECLECPDDLTEIHDLREVTQDGVEGAVCLLAPPLNRNGTWVVMKGFYPVPSLIGPTELLECQTPHACKEFNCSVEYVNGKWVPDCSQCPPDFPADSPLDCHCRAGHMGRLCSHCLCLNSSLCYFRSSSDEGTCTQCAPPSTSVLASALSLLQLSLVAFLMFNQSAIALFGAEFIIVLVLVLLGMGEAWLFDVTIILALLFLISQASKPRKAPKEKKVKDTTTSNKKRALSTSNEIAIPASPSVLVTPADSLAAEAAESENMLRSKMASPIKAPLSQDPTRSEAEESTLAKLPGAESVSGLVKILIFFMQTSSTIVSTNAWPSWSSNLIQRLSALNIRVSGLECFSPELFSEPFGRFIFLMALPWLITVCLIVAALIAKLLIFMRVKKATKMCWRVFKRAVHGKKKKKLKMGKKRLNINAAQQTPSKLAPPAPEQPSSSSSSSSSVQIPIPGRQAATEEGLSPPASPHSPSSLGARKRTARYVPQEGGESSAQPASTADVDSDHEDDRTPLLASTSSAYAALDGDSVQVQIGLAKPKKKKKARKGTMIERIIYSVLFLLFACHFEISNSILSILRPCSAGYMAAFPWIQCNWSVPQYTMLMAGASVFFILYLIGIPVLFFVLLIRSKSEIEAKDHVAAFKIGFLYETYRHPVFWFEMIWLARRILLSMAITLIPITTTFRVASIVLLLLASLFVQRNFMPFNSKLANWLEIASTAVILYSFVVGGMLNKMPGDVGTVKAIMQNLLWILNALVVLVTVGAILARPIGKIFSFWCGRRGRFKKQNESITGRHQE